MDSELAACGLFENFDEEATGFEGGADGLLVIKGGVLPTQELQNPAIFLAIHAIQSADNFGSLLRTAGAFGCREVLVVKNNSSKRLKKARTFGAHGAERRVPMRFFATLESLVAHARRRGCEIVGIEIHNDAIPCTTAFSHKERPACFLPGNEGQGLTSKQIGLCDRLVYVPHFGSATASLNVNAATAIVLSAYATQHKYREAQKTGPKFHVIDPLHLATTSQRGKGLLQKKTQQQQQQNQDSAEEKDSC